MQINRSDNSPSFGLTGRYSKNADTAYHALMNKSQKIAHAINGGKDNFAKITEQDGIKGDFCITDIITKAKDEFIIKFFIKETEKTTFNDQFTIIPSRDIINIREVRTSKQKAKHKTTHNMQDKITTYFTDCYNKNEEKLIKK